MAPAAPLTLGESLAHVSRADRWKKFVYFQIAVPGSIVLMILVAILKSGSPSFFSSVPWRLALMLSWDAYLSLLFMIMSYAELFLPRTPVAVAENIDCVGLWVVGVCVISLMVGTVFAIPVVDTRVLAACTGVVAAFVLGLIALWVWLARTYGGGDGDDRLELELDLEAGSAAA
ncbi:hypothetical protein U9M48_030005 [Paspalum notatum var. saurae]|uniref:DUF7378 domain-containing protein n=1 Tax=Paspalum notatum var. saurae TaxID=547442 RepID=A0AAQ3U014_PASNO